MASLHNIQERAWLIRLFFLSGSQSLGFSVALMLQKRSWEMPMAQCCGPLLRHREMLLLSLCLRGGMALCPVHTVRKQQVKSLWREGVPSLGFYDFSRFCCGE